ncbi:hypothetical protein NDS46_22450 [Paenibacillus thiaminolyticus]|uniref:hypothetical protein n=1 Tax=Paenibacillus thiaminolyticus TaxID=49283 RepID=UPI00232D07E3|nr:hypothetical protein [Paenibacillus thiaminolyticus]WCF07070.1 hypothetical protein NDS46_22450 [Paenibacillus thiaminolyticus]
MQGLKLTNVIGERGGQYDYKGLDIDKFVPGSQVYPSGTRDFFVITQEEHIPEHEDIHFITKEDYAEAYNAEANREPAPNPIEEMQKQIDAMQLALMGMMDAGGNA